ncbi:unnamed protein product [Closterium sp. NIES-54]
MVCTRVLQQQGQPQHSWQWGPEGPRSTGRSGGLASSGHDVGPCGYRILTGPGFGTTCWSLDHSASRCYRRLDDLHCVRFGPHTIPPHWPSHNRQRTAAPAESHLPGQGPFPAARVETCVSSLGACVVSSPGASERLCVGVETTTSLAPAFVAGSGATSQTAQLSFTLESGASSYFFRDCTDVTPLRTPVTIALADPSVGPVVAHSTTTLPCPVAPSGFLTGYYTPSFSRSLVRSGQVAAVSCDCRSLTHPPVLWHHRLGHPSFPCLSRMARYRLVPGLPESLAPLPRSPAPPCTPCVEGRQRAAPHSSSFPPTTAPFQTLHLDVWGPSPVLGPRQERYFLIVVDNYSRYTTGFPLRRKADVPTILEPWLLAWGGAQGLCGLRLHSDRGAPPPLRPAPLGVLHVTPQSSPPQRPVPVVSGGAGGAVAEGEGNGAAGAGGVGSGGAGVVGVEVTLVEDTAASNRRPRPASPPGFPSVPQFRPRSSLRPVAAEPGGVPAGGTKGPRAVGGGGARSGGAGVGGTGTVAPTPRTVLSHQKPEEAERQRLRLRDLLDPALARLVRGPLPSPHVPPVLSLSLSLWTRRSPLSLAVSPEPRRSGYRADGPFHLVLRSRARPPPILPQPPKSSLAVLHDPLSDYLRASRPIVSRVLSALVTHSTAPLPSVSALVTIVAGFASSHRLDYAAHLVSGPARSPSFGGALVFALEVLEDMQFELGFLAATVPHLCAKLLALEGDPNALDIPIPRNHAEAVLGPWASYWIAVEEAEMASYRSTSTYVDAVPPPGTNVVSGRWLYKVKRPPGSPLVFKARYVTRGFTQRDYELQSLHFSTAFLQGSLHEQIWLRRPPSFIGSFPPGTQWQLHGPVYGLRQAPHERHDTLCSTLAALDFFPSSADPSLFVRRGSTPFFVLVYVDDLAFATLDRRALASVKEELQRRHTCTDLGELQHYIGLQIVM